jgi:nucleoside-diphosphate-sugar epimerase
VTPRIAITGGSGFVGTNLVEHCLRAGLAVLSLDPAAPRHPGHVHVWRRIDPLSVASVRRELVDFRPSHVLHMGARTDLHGASVRDYPENTTGVSVILEACTELDGVSRVIFASSRLVCRIGYEPAHESDYDATTPYGQSKVIGERLVRAASPSFSWVIVRPTSIWGPWFDVPYKDFFLSVYRNRYVHVRGQDVRKSFGFVGNTVLQLMKLLGTASDEGDGKTMYLSDPPISVRDMADRIQGELGSRPIRTVPLQVLKPIAFAGDLARWVGWKEPPLTTFRLNNLLTNMVYDTAPLEALVGPPPHTLGEGVVITAEWLRQQGEVSSTTNRRTN